MEANADKLTVRRIRECCAQLHSCVQKWKELNSQSVDVAGRLVNTTLQSKYTEDRSNYGELKDIKVLPPSVEGKVIEERELLYSQLQQITAEMGKVVDKMGSLTANLKAAAELLSSAGNGLQWPLFATLSAWDFSSYAEEVFTAYSQELSLKQSILEDLLKQSNRDTLTVYLSSWLHQPFVDVNSTDKLEAMLIETNLRAT